VEIALVHEVGANTAARVLLKQHVVGQDHRGAAAGPQPAVDVLEEGELLVGGGIGEVVAGGLAAALLGAEWRVGEDDVGLREIRAEGRQRVAELEVGCEVVEEGVHE